MSAWSSTVVALGFTLLATVPSSASVQLRLAPVIGDGMVLQRDVTVPIWGWAERGEIVVVTFDGRTYTAISDTSGRWTVKLPPRAAGGPYVLTASGKREQLQVRDILVGDVWFGAGQSNMGMPVKKVRNGAQEIAAAHDVKIRHWAPYPAKWSMADSAHVGDFSGVGYFFARELRKSIDVPIGLITAAPGGSTMAQWVGAAIPLPAGGNVPRQQRVEESLTQRFVHPLLPYPIKGILWYQGEDDAHRSYDHSLKYRELFPRLIRDWRRKWGLGDLPFLFVQLPGYGTSTHDFTAVLRESQSAALRLPNTAQIVTLDLKAAPGEDPGHPGNKQDIGVRLALVARKVAYGEKVEYAGPRYRRHTLRDGRVRLQFDHTGRGLVIGGEGNELQGFSVAGADRQFVSASARIEGDRVVVWSERVSTPVAVRYAWANRPQHANLYNRAGLPAAPFRTDEWSREPRARD